VAEPYSYEEAQELSSALSLSEPVAIALVRRGYRTAEEARAFLDADESHPPGAFRSMAAVVAQVLAAIEAGEQITVHGDFDVDGVCATTILVSALRELGAECDWLIPDRMADGYGLSADNLRKLANRGTKLLITVDCGVTAVEEVKLAEELGMAVIVTDHHQPGESLPDCPILHPVVDGYPFEELCGTAVAWKLASALRGASGVRALLAAAKCDLSQLDEGDLAFRLGPRINAAGRLYRADAGVELFLTEDEARAEEIAIELSRANGERRATEREVANEAEAALRALPDQLREAHGLVVAGEGWHPGVIGIVASRLVESHRRPVVVISLDGEGGGRGSGRSIPGFDLLAGLEACSEHLSGFGGHKAAAGLQLKAANVDAFRQAFAAHANSVLGPEDLKRTERIDAIVGGASLGLGLAEELGQLAPFGMGNPGVRLLVPSAKVRDVRAIGEGKHARFSLHSGSHRALGVAFGRSTLGVGEDDLVDVAVRLEVNRWNGAVEPQVVLRDLYRRAAAEDAPEAEEWWRRFGAELSRDPSSSPPEPAEAPGKYQRRLLGSTNAPAAVARELASSGESVLVLCADATLRAGLAGEGLRLADYAELEQAPGLPAGFSHVVLFDPPPFERLERLASRADREGRYLHRAWGEAEWCLAARSVAEQLAQRPTLIGLFRDLRDAAPSGGEELRKALLGSGSQPRRADVAARCFRVLAELGLVEGTPGGGGGEVGVVSSEGTDLEDSSSFRAYSARYQEAKLFLERQRQP